MPHRLSRLAPLRPRGREELGSYRGILNRTRRVAAAFMTFGLALLSLGIWRANDLFKTIEHDERLRAENLVSRTADRLILSLNGRFADLRFLGRSLLDVRSTKEVLTRTPKKALREFLMTHPMVSNVNILSPD